jgi:hypothetical protein
MEDFKRLFEYIPNNFNPHYEYDYENGTSKLKSVSYGYINIGNNIELDTLGTIASEKYMFMWMHIRGVDQVSTTFLADMLSTIREWIIEKMSMVTDYEELMKNIPADFTVQIGGVIIDPGFNGHLSDEPKEAGLKLTSFMIHHPHLFVDRPLDSILKNDIKLKKLIYSPQEYYDTLKVSKDIVEEMNSLLAQTAAQKNAPKKIRILFNQILKKGGGFIITFPWEDTMALDMSVKWSYESDTMPSLIFDVEHLSGYHGLLRAYWRHTSLKKDGTFVLQVNKNYTEYFHNETDHNKFVEFILRESKDKIAKLFSKHHIYIIPDSAERKWRVDFI